MQETLTAKHTALAERVLSLEEEIRAISEEIMAPSVHHTTTSSEPLLGRLQQALPGNYTQKDQHTLVADYGMGNVYTLTVLPDGRILEESRTPEYDLGTYANEDELVEAFRRGDAPAPSSDGQPEPKKVPPTLKLLRSDSFTWGEWKRACFEESQSCLPGEVLAEYMTGDRAVSKEIYWQIRLIEHGQDEDTAELTGIWDGHPDTMEHPTEGTLIDIWAGSDGPGGGTGQVRYRVLEAKSLFRVI